MQGCLQRKNYCLRRFLLTGVKKSCNNLIGLECIFMGFGRSAGQKWLVFCLNKEERNLVFVIHKVEEELVTLIFRVLT